jgi:hypothetical protein
MAIPIIDPFGAMQQGMKMRAAREQYESKNKLNDLYRTTDWSNPQAIERAIPQAIAAGGPEAASSFVTLLGHMDETQKRQAKSHRDAVGRVWMQIQSAPEQARPQLYAQAQGVYPQEFDQPYSPQALQAMLYELQDFDDAFKSFTQGQEAPKTVGGMQWNPNAIDPRTGGKGAFVAIPGYTEQASAIAAAGRAPQTDANVWETVEVPGVGRVQHNRRTGQYQSFPGQDSGGVTSAQFANNAEIDAARRYLTESGLGMADVIARTQEQTATGRENPDYDPYLARSFNLAMQRKIGDDPDFESFQSRYRGGSTATPPPSGVNPLADANGNGGAASELPRDSSGQIDPSKLITNKVYDTPNGKFKWTGTDFIQVP